MSVVSALIHALHRLYLPQCKKAIRKDGLSDCLDAWQFTAHCVHRPTGRCRRQRSKARFCPTLAAGDPALPSALQHLPYFTAYFGLFGPMQKGHP